MLFALKQIYSFLICVLKFQNELSNSIRMERGVRQGAASSVLLFNSFNDGLSQHLETKCSIENFLNNLHVLIHADDTIILSTEKGLFIQKCKEMIDFFSINKLTQHW